MRIGYLMQKGVDIRRLPHDGPANHVRHVIEELRGYGHHVRLVSEVDGTIWKSDDLAVFEPVVVKRADGGPWRWLERAVRRIQRELHLPYAGLFESVRFALACCEVLRSYDLLFERRSWMTYGGALAAQWLHIPLVFEDNGDPLADLEAKGIAPRGVQRRLSLAIMRRSMHTAAHVVASGDGWRKASIERWGLDEQKVTTVENGTVLVDLLRREQLRSFLPTLSENQTATLVYVGGFYPWHGITILLRAFAQAAARGTKAHLLLIGSGPGLNGAQELVRELGISHLATFAGHLPAREYAPLLADADIGLSPYCNWPEFSGLKVLDYKAAGLATIASGREGQPTTICHGQTGWIVEPCCEQSLTEAIIELTSNADLRRRLGRAARIEAEQRHGWNHTVNQLEQIFNKVSGR
jgi:glycosyltransferase involved in cell wall biosynthesis